MEFHPRFGAKTDPFLKQQTNRFLQKKITSHVGAASAQLPMCEKKYLLGFKIYINVFACSIKEVMTDGISG